MIAKFSLTPKARENPGAGRRRPRRARPESRRVSAFPAPVTETGLSVILYLDEMLAGCSKEHLVECAQLLALDVAHYKQKYGELPVEEHLAVTPQLTSAMTLQNSWRAPYWRWRSHLPWLQGTFSAVTTLITQFLTNDRFSARVCLVTTISLKLKTL